MSPDFDIITSCCKRHVCSKHVSSASVQALSSQHLPETTSQSAVLVVQVLEWAREAPVTVKQVQSVEELLQQSDVS